MRKAVVYSLLATAFVILLLTKNISHNHHYEYLNDTPLSLNRRLGFKNNHVPPNFDPLVSKMERDSDEIISYGASSMELDYEDEDNEDEPFYEDGKLNITLRIMVLFPFLDTDPNDGFINNQELEAWVLQQAAERLDHSTRQDLRKNDLNGDGFISFSEYLPQFSQEDIERNDMRHGNAGWWMEQFINADADQDGKLSFYEYRDFLHPEESKNEKIQNWLLAGKVRQMEYDHNGKLNLLEFQTGAYDIYRHYAEFERRGANVPSSTDVFDRLDVNHDNLLEAEELKPIIHYLCPGELSYAKYYALYLINAADENGDRKLTLQEMINNDSIFYNTVYDGNKYVDDENLHDEL
ncbi:hypothetical protein LguiB_003794 [Lonicera macranthoides]